IHDPANQLAVAWIDVRPHGMELEPLLLHQLAIEAGHREYGTVPAFPQRQGQPDVRIRIAERAEARDDDLPAVTRHPYAFLRSGVLWPVSTERATSGLYC